MKEKRRTEITLQTEELVLVRHKGGAGKSWCTACGRTVTRLNAEKAATLAGVSERTIYRWVEDDLLHYTESSGGHLLICVDSLVSRKL